MKKFLLLIAVSVALSSCSMRYYYKQSMDNSIGGKAVIIPTSPTKRTYVMLNDSLILTKVYLKSLTLENLPDGEYKVNFQSYIPAYTQKLNETLLIRIENGGSTTSLIAVPPKSKASWIAKGVITSAVIVFLLNPLY